MGHHARPGHGADDRSQEAVRRSNLREPLPAGAAIENPIAQLERDGVAPPTQLIKVQPPEHEYDGRRGLVFFTPVAKAVSYDIWVSPKPDGADAVRQAQGWTEPGRLLTGLSANVDQYLFVTWTDKDGKVSKPSAPLKVNMRDMFPMK